MDSPDLQFKYQKLAFEYSKLRAQNQVLKRAVKDEQEKALQLKEDINLRDQSLRKAEQELDSLSFRNQQLTKRLSLLQEDLEIVKSKAKKGTKPDSLPSDYFNDSNVYAEELESKINENERLHAELRDLEAFFKNKITELENKCEEISRNSAKRPESICSKDEPVQTAINRIEECSVSPEIIKHQKNEKCVIGAQLKSFPFLENKNTVSQLKALKKTHSSDATSQSLGGKSSKIMLRELIDPVNELASGFIGFITSYFLFLKKLSPTAAQFKIVDENSQDVSSWKEFSKSFEEIVTGICKWDATTLSNLNGISSFYNNTLKCLISVKKLHLLSERLFCLQNTQMETAWKKSLGCVASSFTSAIPYISTLTYLSHDRIAVPGFTLKKTISLFQERISKLVAASNELLTVWSSLVAEDKEETVITSLINIHKSFSKINSFCIENLIPLKDSSPDSLSISSALAPSPEMSHIPYSAATFSIDNNFVFSCLQENYNNSYNETSLAQQLSQATSRLAKLEEEREHWKLECQLLSHRLNKEIKVGEIEESFCPSEEREKQIRDHFTNRCSQLFLQLTSCISQAALYQNECENLLHCLAINEESRALVERQVEEQRKEKTQIQETLSTTSRNYEEQISAMSDHIADMNEKIALQAETIEQLSFQLKKRNFK